MRKDTYQYYLPLLGLICFFALWQVISTFVLKFPALLPPPSKVFKAMIDLFVSGNLLADMLSSLRRIFVGFLLAFVAASLFGVITYRYARTYSFVRLIMNLLSSIPPIAWTPIAILWFGIGDAPAYFIVFLGAFFPMFSNFYAAINGVDQKLINVARTLGVSKKDISETVIIPAILPHVFQGVRIGISIAWFNVIAAELIGVNSGLGYKIQLSRELLASENVVALMLLVGIMGLIMNSMVTVAGNLVAPWGLQSEKQTRWLSYHKTFKKLLKRSGVPAIAKAKKDAAITSDLTKDIVKIRHLSKSFQKDDPSGKLTVLNDITFGIKTGKVVSIVGPNGSGKSTIINIVSGLLQPDGGIVEFQGEVVRSPSSDRTVVFQDLALFPWQTCREHIAYSLKYNKNKGQMFDVTGYLKLANLEEFADNYPFELSGGMKQRLAVMRAIAAEPKIILMDEPFASLDPLIRNSSQESILKILKSQGGATVLLVTHDIDEAIFMSDEVIVLSNRPTVIKEIIRVDLGRPRSAPIRASNDFSIIRNQIWDLLNDNKSLLKQEKL